ncbi:hypothetical protein BH24ACT26_BH24ACT26_13470 [soil metagenome]
MLHVMSPRRGPTRLVAVIACLALGLDACAGTSQDGAVRRTTAEKARDLRAAPQDRAGVGSDASSARELGRFRRRRAMVHVRRLASRIGVRIRATPGERRGAAYAASRLRSLGYIVKVGRFPVDGATSRNVTAKWPGAKRYPVVIGGHMDSVATSPGANDNASGIAVILELARLVAGRPQARFVKFVAFGSEEYGTDGRHHVGSQRFVDRLGARGRRRLAGMVSVDMVGKLLGRALIIGTAGIGSKVVARTVIRRARRAGVDVTYRTTCDCSDNGPFERAGIPAAFAWSGLEPNYHSSGDTVASVSSRSVMKTGRALRALIRGLDAGLIRRLRRSG